MTHHFTDRNGIEWTVTWKLRSVHAQRVGGEPEWLPTGLEFTSSAVVFRVPMKYWVHPRVIPEARLQAMVDRALEGDVE